uniref:RING-type domain-containing protein n=2 Tax=Brassica oleracea var. oleracea TaxID=109376 RepID=A0A0D3AJA8_BRAOL
MATVVLAQFSASTCPVPDSDPDPPFTLLSDLLDVAPPPEPPDPLDPSDSFLPLCRPYILEASAFYRISRSSFDASTLVSSGMQLSTALCSPILGENPWLPFAGPFAPCIKRSRGLNYLNRSLLLLWNEDVVLSLKLFLPQFEDVAGYLSAFIKQDSESVAVLGGLFPKLPHALNGVDAKEVSQALVGYALMVEALKLRSALLKAKELILFSFHIFSDSQVFIFTLRFGFVLNEIAGVLHDVRSLATLFNPLSFSFILCFDNIQAVNAGLGGQRGNYAVFRGSTPGYTDLDIIVVVNLRTASSRLRGGDLKLAENDKEEERDEMSKKEEEEKQEMSKEEEDKQEMTKEKGEEEQKKSEEEQQMEKNKKRGSGCFPWVRSRQRQARKSNTNDDVLEEMKKEYMLQEAGNSDQYKVLVIDAFNMIRPHVELSDFKHERRSGSYPNSIIIVVDTISDEIQVSPSVRVDISLPSFLGRHHIRRLIQDQLINRLWLSPKISRTATKLGFSRREVLQDQFASHRWLSDRLAPEISEIAATLGFGCNGLIVTITVNITPSPSKEEVLRRMVQLGKVSKEELKTSKMETEPCSICLDNFVSSKHGVSTRMTCSHVFHEKCLLVWFQRKNTCPLCRTVLYDRLMIGNKGRE